ncbi:PREDICTED: C2 calcium-dependent domain-containing protein 4A [Bison bison bison]|uniref:C2 calcium-dependent domain-containing protein 4A n=1 Tax=Bison bison bison TaxID=43346 RepID=A0A6P3HKP1_BISBB|nr:PREDICTED: C2 calcium-dependent domain-containing protein 4A [Bison bison bison]
MRLLGKLRASSSAPLEPAFSNVLTPNRIPEFFIPPRLPTPYAPESSPPAAALPRRCAAEPDLWLRGADDGAGRTDWDPPTQAPVTSLSPHRDPRPERLEAEGTVTLGRAGGALRLAAEYNRASGRLRVRLLRAEGPAGGAAEPRAPVGCRISFVLKPRGAVVRRSRRAVLEQDLCLDGLSEDEVRRLAVRVKAENRGRGLERGRLLGQGELLLGPLLLL